MLRWRTLLQRQRPGRKFRQRPAEQLQVGRTACICQAGVGACWACKGATWHAAVLHLRLPRAHWICQPPPHARTCDSLQAQPIHQLRALAHNTESVRAAEVTCGHQGHGPAARHMPLNHSANHKIQRQLRPCAPRRPGLRRPHGHTAVPSLAQCNAQLQAAALLPTCDMDLLHGLHEFEDGKQAALQPGRVVSLQWVGREAQQVQTGLACKVRLSRALYARTAAWARHPASPESAPGVCAPMPPPPAPLHPKPWACGRRRRQGKETSGLQQGAVQTLGAAADTRGMQGHVHPGTQWVSIPPSLMAFSNSV